RLTPRHFRFFRKYPVCNQGRFHKELLNRKPLKVVWQAFPNSHSGNVCWFFRVLLLRQTYELGLLLRVCTDTILKYKGILPARFLVSSISRCRPKLGILAKPLLAPECAK